MSTQDKSLGNARLSERASLTYVSKSDRVSMDLPDFGYGLDLIWDILSAYAQEHEIGLMALIGNEEVCFSKGMQIDRMRISGKTGEDSGEIFFPEDRIAIHYCARNATSAGRVVFSIAIKESAQGKFGEGVVANLSRLGLHLLLLGADFRSFRAFVKQLVQERDAVSGLIVDGLLILDRSGFLRYINEAGAAILKIKNREKLFGELLGFEPIISDIFETGRSYTDRRVVIFREGEEITLMDTAIPVVDDRRGVVSVVNIFRRQDSNDSQSPQGIRYSTGSHLSDLAGKSSAFVNMRNDAGRLAKMDENILIHGEPGTGKSFLAQVIHGDSNYSDRALLVIDCRKLAVVDFEERVFAFRTSEEWAGQWRLREDLMDPAVIGSIFFDGIDALPISSQIDLFAALSGYRQACAARNIISPKGKIRIIASMTSTADIAIQERRLHPKLSHIMSGANLLVPALRERLDDVNVLTQAFFSEKGCHDVKLPSKVRQLLKKQIWPRNVAQLKAVVNQLVEVDAHLHSEKWFMEKINELVKASAISTRSQRGDLERLSMQDAERQAIYLALRAMSFNISRAASALGISRPTLYAKIKKYDIEIRW